MHPIQKARRQAEETDKKEQPKHPRTDQHLHETHKGEGEAQSGFERSEEPVLGAKQRQES